MYNDFGESNNSNSNHGNIVSNEELIRAMSSMERQLSLLNDRLNVGITPASTNNENAFRDIDSGIRDSI
jgi:hypothetical protein